MTVDEQRERPDDGPTDRQERYQQALLDLTTHGAVVEGDFEAAAGAITETAAAILDVDRVNVWLFDDEGTRLRCVDHYDRRTGDHDAGMELVAADYPDYVDALRRHRSIAADEARNDPRTACLTADYLDPEGVDALLDATLRSEGEVVGVVCHEELDGPREWTEAEVQFAADIADVAHRALRNYRAAEQRERLEMQRSLLEAQQEAILDGLVVVGTDDSIVSYNDNFAELFDIPTDLLEDGDLNGLTGALEDRLADPSVFAERRAYLYENPDASTQLEVELEDGSVLTAYSTPVEAADGTRHGRLWMVRDVTERRQRAQELELKNRAIEEAPIGITLTDTTDGDNPLTYVNQRFVGLTGYDEAELLGRNCRFLQGEATEQAPIDRMREAIADAEPVTVELRNYRTDGSTFWNRVTIAPVRDAEDTVTNYVGFQQDVSDRREATRQLKVLHRVLRHNLSNRLTIVRGTAEQLAANTSGEANAGALDIVEETDRLLEITDKHREIVRLLSERPAPRPTAVDRTVAEAVRTVAAECPAASLQVDGPTDATAMAIPALQTALEELFENAVLHSADDAPTVEISVHQHDDEVELRVADEGPGLPEEERRILVGDQDVDPLFHGVGMGLWLVYWIVALSGGSISVAENEPQGTVVRIELERE